MHARRKERGFASYQEHFRRTPAVICQGSFAVLPAVPCEALCSQAACCMPDACFVLKAHPACAVMSLSCSWNMPMRHTTAVH